MLCPFIQRIFHWPDRCDHPKGTMTAATALLSLVFSALALSMLTMSRIHLEISGAKKDIQMLEFAAENGVKQGYDELARLMRSRPEPQPVGMQEKETFYQDCLDSGTDLAEYFYGVSLPLHCQGAWEQMEWTANSGFQAGPVREGNGYFQADYNFTVAAMGRLESTSRKKQKSLTGGLAFFCGRLPLSIFPLAFDNGPPPDYPSGYLEKQGVSLSHPERGELQPYFSENPLIPDLPEATVEKALKTDIFHPQDLTPRRLRAVLGLEESDDPVPEGVYLIQDDLGLGGVFVQGDVREMILAVTNGFQAVYFALDAGEWLLTFNPAESKTRFITPEEEFNYALIPRGIIIINGAVQSLGGGIKTAAGKYELVRSREIPCVLNSVRLTIISTDEVTLSTHLLQEGVDWKEGLPYLKDGKAQLNIFAAGCGLGSEEDGKGQITVSEDAPQNIKIHASLTAAGEGFHIQGENKTVTLFGGLQTTDITNPDSRLDILADERFLRYPELMNESPQSKTPLLHAAGFFIKEWNEHE
jgi:hypothetical protein